MTGPDATRKEPRRKGIYVLPNLFTSLNLFCGFHALVASVDGRFHAAAVSILIALIFDILDGKIARATGTTSRFGVEYDSLADLVSFGVAPGLMIYLWALSPLGRIGWLAAFLFAICGALRLARFNARVDSVPGDYFQGLPIPAAAGMNAAIVLLCHRFGIDGTSGAVQVVALMTLYALAFLMVSSIRYFSFKKGELLRQMNFNALVAGILVFVFIAAHPPVALFLVGIGYVASGPVLALRRMHRRREEGSGAR